MRKGSVHTSESKAKIAAAKLGKTFTPEHSLAIGNALRGKKKSVEHKKAISLGIKEAYANRIDRVVALDVNGQGTAVA